MIDSKIFMPCLSIQKRVFNPFVPTGILQPRSQSLLSLFDKLDKAVRSPGNEVAEYWTLSTASEMSAAKKPLTMRSFPPRK